MSERERPQIEVQSTRCPYCHDSLERGVKPEICPSCHALHHTECWEEYGACSACGGREIEQPEALDVKAAAGKITNEERAVEGAPQVQRCAFTSSCDQKPVQFGSACRQHTRDASLLGLFLGAVFSGGASAALVQYPGVLKTPLGLIFLLGSVLIVASLVGIFLAYHADPQE